jgi:UDP-N-acetylglucosamine 2-epimerase
MLHIRLDEFNDRYSERKTYRKFFASICLKISPGNKRMTNKLKVVTVVGTRPEIIRLSRVLAALDSCCEHYLIHTGQNYDHELNGIFFDEMGLSLPNKYMNTVGSSLFETIGNIIAYSGAAFNELHPDAVLVLGDTNSALSIIAAKRLKIPSFHMEAGNRCFDLRVPEEINRKIVDHTADINLPYSQIARSYLINEGLPPQQIIVTGSPIKEVLSFYADLIDRSTVLERLELDPSRFFLVSAHRDETIENPVQFKKLIDIINKLPKIFDLPVIVSTHPRTRKKITDTAVEFDPRVVLHKPFGFADYNKLQKNARVVLSDSGTITEESSILGFPAVNLRETHERPEGMEETAVMMVGLNWDRVEQCIRIVSNDRVGCCATMKVPRDYDIDNVSQKVTRILHSYVDYVNREVFRK